MIQIVNKILLILLIYLAKLKSYVVKKRLVLLPRPARKYQGGIHEKTQMYLN